MPVYEFTCQDCRTTFEVTRPIADAGHGSTPCPQCGSARTERTWSRVFAITDKKS